MSDIPAREAKVYMQAARRLPVTIVRGRARASWDDTGKEYLDFVAGIAVVSLGHADAQLADVIAQQARTLITVSNIFYTEPQIELAELLVRHSALDRVFFVNSGAEANESAIKLARKWGNLHKDGAFEIISTNNSFHGRTIGAVSATGTPRYREPFGPQLPGFVFVDYDDIEALQGGDQRAHGGGAARAGAGRGRHQRAGAGLPASRCARGATSSGYCSSSTRCRRAWAAPARCGRTSRPASSRTS